MTEIIVGLGKVKVSNELQDCKSQFLIAGVDYLGRVFYEFVIADNTLTETLTTGVTLYDTAYFNGCT